MQKRPYIRFKNTRIHCRQICYQLYVYIFSPDTVSFSNQMELDSAAKKVQSMVHNYYGTSLYCNGMHLHIYIQVFKQVSASPSQDYGCAMFFIVQCAKFWCGLSKRQANLLHINSSVH